MKHIACAATLVLTCLTATPPAKASETFTKGLLTVCNWILQDAMDLFGKDISPKKDSIPQKSSDMPVYVLGSGIAVDPAALLSKTLKVGRTVGAGILGTFGPVIICHEYKEVNSEDIQFVEYDIQP